MQCRQLGRTGLYVSELCLGTITFGDNPNAGFWSSIGALGQEEANGLIGRARDAGINFIDTADIYAFGASESLVGRALKELEVPRSQVLLTTKTGGVMGNEPIDRVGIARARHGFRPAES